MPPPHAPQLIVIQANAQYWNNGKACCLPSNLRTPDATTPAIKVEIRNQSTVLDSCAIRTGIVANVPAIAIATGQFSSRILVA